MKNLVRFIGFLSVLIVFLMGLAFYWTIWKPIPQYDATIESSELSSPVDIYWDDFGIPHIYAQTKQDLYYALGYVHAQDRRWQLTLAQLAMEGRFAEFLGPDLVPLDTYQRTLGFWNSNGHFVFCCEKHRNRNRLPTCSACRGTRAICICFIPTF